MAVLLGVIAAVAIPSFLNMRAATNTNICVANLRQINSAVEQWGLLSGLNEGGSLTPYEDEIYDYIRGDKPTCPSGGTYTLTNLGQHPQIRCNVAGHALSE